MTALTLPPRAAEDIVAALAFNADGLIPAVAQQWDTGEILMMAWMNTDAVTRTLTTGTVHYYSRSRKTLWLKGETSGHIQTLRDFRYDCDADTVLVLVDQAGVACHTGRRSCFFNRVGADGGVADAPVPQFG